MILKKEYLVPFNVMNKNGRIYTKNSYDWNKLINESPYFGEIAEEHDYRKNNSSVKLSNVSHSIENIKIYQDGIYADIKILETHKGKLLKNLINSGIGFVFRLFGFGTTNTGTTNIKSINGFDALLIENDSYEPHIFRRQKIERIMKRINDNR
jgi:hypothetical protein